MPLVASTNILTAANIDPSEIFVTMEGGKLYLYNPATPTQRVEWDGSPLKIDNTTVWAELGTDADGLVADLFVEDDDSPLQTS